MGQYRRLTLSAKSNKTQRDSFQEKASVDNDYLRNCELRLCFLEDAIENGELVFLKDEKVEETRWIKSVARAMCSCNCPFPDECNYECSYKDYAKKLYIAKKVSL